MKFKKIIKLYVFLISAVCLVSGCQKNNLTEEKIGYISNINIKERSFDFDEIEWITLEDKEKIKELNLDENFDFPNDFYINNSSKEKSLLTLSKKAVFEFLDWKDDFKAKSVNLEEFSNQHTEFFETYLKPNETDILTPYWIEIENDNVISIKQQYIP